MPFLCQLFPEDNRPLEYRERLQPGCMRYTKSFASVKSTSHFTMLAHTASVLISNHTNEKKKHISSAAKKCASGEVIKTTVSIAKNYLTKGTK